MEVSAFPGDRMQELGEDIGSVEPQDILSLLAHLKVLTRKKKHRIPLGEKYIPDLLGFLQDKSVPAHVAAEAANVILNLCYEKPNVDLVLNHNGAPALIELLHSEDEELQANAAGALQSICFQPNGRQLVRALGAITWLVQLLSANSISVRARATGALHNISSDGEAIREIRREGGIKSLIPLLQSRQLSICGSAAGALQNISREVASRTIIRNSDAVFSLVHLLDSSELQTQICAAGALLNLLGRESSPACVKKRASIVRSMRNLVLVSTLYNLFFTQEARRIYASLIIEASHYGW